MKPAAQYNKCGRCGETYPHTIEYFVPLRQGTKNPSGFCVYCQAADMDKMQKVSMEVDEEKRQYEGRKQQEKFINFMKRYEREDKGVVYFLRCRNLIKIGRSINHVPRIAAIRLEYRRTDIHLLGVIPGGDITERNLHNQFQHLRRYRKEWFKAAPELIEWILANAQLI